MLLGSSGVGSWRPHLGQACVHSDITGTEAPTIWNAAGEEARGGENLFQCKYKVETREAPLQVKDHETKQ